MEPLSLVVINIKRYTNFSIEELRYKIEWMKFSNRIKDSNGHFVVYTALEIEVFVSLSFICEKKNSEFRSKNVFRIPIHQYCHNTIEI